MNDIERRWRRQERFDYVTEFLLVTLLSLMTASLGIVFLGLVAGLFAILMQF